MVGVMTIDASFSVHIFLLLSNSRTYEAVIPKRLSLPQYKTCLSEQAFLSKKMLASSLENIIKNIGGEISRVGIAHLQTKATEFKSSEGKTFHENL
jgi:hypothetical protein